MFFIYRYCHLELDTPRNPYISHHLHLQTQPKNTLRLLPSGPVCRPSSPRASDSFMTFCTLIYIYIHIYLLRACVHRRVISNEDCFILLVCELGLKSPLNEKIYDIPPVRWFSKSRTPSDTSQSSSERR